jgi:hypothetical protein
MLRPYFLALIEKESFAVTLLKYNNIGILSLSHR